MFQYFNTTKGIAKAVVDLTSLQVLFNDRRALRKDNPSAVLNEFVIFGWIILDEFGQVNFIDQIVQKETLTDISLEVRNGLAAVVSMTEFKKYMKKMNVDHWQISVTNHRRRIPFHTTVCPCCKQPWTLDNMRDVVSEDHTFFADEIAFHLSKEIRHELAIEMSKRPLSVNGVFDTALFVSSRLSLLTRANWTVGTEDDKINMFVRHDLYHKACYQQVLHKTTCQQFEKAFREAGINVFGQIRTRNLYGSEAYKGSWFIFDTEYGPIKIGWRKRVIDVNYSFIAKHYLPANTDETCGPGFEHVEGYEALTQRLKVFARYITQQCHPLTSSLVNFIAGEYPKI